MAVLNGTGQNEDRNETLWFSPRSEESIMSWLLHTRLFGLCSVFILFFSWSSMASADCSDATVKRMAGQGKTVASIARACKMSKEDAQSILEEENLIGDDGGNSGGPQGFPSGTPIGQCGCWGPVDPRMQQPAPQCQSGYASPSSCNINCPAGGWQWRGVCG